MEKARCCPVSRRPSLSWRPACRAVDELSLRTVRWAGFDPDLCRAAAAAVFDRPEKVTLIPFMSKDCFTALQADEVDLLSQTAACTGQGAAKEFDIADFVLNHEAVIFRAGEKAVDASHRRDASGHRRTGFATRWMKSSTPQEPVVLSGTISKGPAALSPPERPDIRRLSGIEGDFGAALGLDRNRAYRIPHHVGNYGESFREKPRSGLASEDRT